MAPFFRLIALSLLTLAAPLRAETVPTLRGALDLAARGAWEDAMAAAPAGLAQDIIQWQRLRAGEGTLGEYEAFLARHSDWPALALLKQKGEAAAARSETPSRVLAYFGRDLPRSAPGALALVRALLAEGNRDLAETEAMRAWAELSFSETEAAALRNLLPEAVARADAARMENLLWNEKLAEAERLLPHLSAERAALARARIALRRDTAGVDALLTALPQKLQSDPGLMWERFGWRMRKDRYDEAVALLIAMPPDALGRPEIWAERRALLARWLMRQDRATEAYRLASTHGLQAGSDYADLEFLSGFIALRKLGDPALALKHFGHLKAGVSTPISVSRAEYWLGRAEEARDRMAEAEAHYLGAARFQTAYYGLLAAERLGLPLNEALLKSPPAPDWKQAAWAKSSVFAAAKLLHAAGDRQNTKRFLLHLAESQDATGLAQLASWALSVNEPHLAVVIAKAAAERGVILPHAYYPIPAFVPEGLRVSRALALAISRRESEFDPGARSHADARGLMQLLPGTGALMAKELGVEFEPSKLFTDPALNVTLGAAYLGKMVEEFGPSIALVASGYNAGPGRPRRWITELGDPRRPDVDVVDWVETIPFAETRTYVMRVVEGVVIYRARLRGETGPIRVISELKG